jgi:hypothetical protein
MLQLDTTDNYYMTVKYPVGQNKQTNKQRFIWLQVIKHV